MPRLSLWPKRYISKLPDDVLAKWEGCFSANTAGYQKLLDDGPSEAHRLPGSS
jgi:hypothetical protein